MGKKYNEYTVDDLVRLELSFLLKDKTDEEIVAQRDAFIYLKNTARSCHIDIGKWKLLEMFGDGTTNNMVTEKAKINEILFSRIHEVKALDATAGHGFSLLTGFKKEIMDATKVNYDSAIRDTRSALESNERSITDYNRQVALYIKRSREKQDKISDLEAKKLTGLGDDTAYKAVQQILTNKYWQFIGIQEGRRLLFATTEYVKQSLVNPAAGIDINVEYGVFYVSIDIKDKLISCYPYMDSVIAFNPHPHVHGTGDICWGNFRDTVEEHMGKDNWKEVMDTLQTLLSTYCGDNPYTSIQTINDYYKTLLVDVTSDDGDYLAKVFSGAGETGDKRVEALTSRLSPDNYPLHITPTREVPIYMRSSDGVFDETHDEYPFMDYTIGGREIGLFLWNTESRRLYHTIEHSDDSQRVRAVRMSGGHGEATIGYADDMNYGKYKVFKNYKELMKSVPHTNITDAQAQIVNVFEECGIFRGCPVASMQSDGTIDRTGVLRSLQGDPNSSSFLNDNWTIDTYLKGYGSCRMYSERFLPMPLRLEGRQEYIDRLEKYRAKITAQGTEHRCERTWAEAKENLLQKWSDIHEG